MFQPKLILVPVDFSDPARTAVDAAAEMATRFGSSLLLTHVVPFLPPLPADFSPLREGEYEQRLHDDAVRNLKETAARYAPLAVRTHVGMANDVAMELVRIAEQEGADLIVITTHGKSGWNRLVFGSVAEKVVKLAHGPVLVLRAAPPK